MLGSLPYDIAGQYTLTLAWSSAGLQVFFSLWSSYRHDADSPNINSINRLTKGLITATFILLSLALLTLALAFLGNQFSLPYVAANSNTHLPWYYKIAAVWAGHEGSLLLWAWILSLWSWAVSRQIDRDAASFSSIFVARVLAVLGGVSFGFITFLMGLSNPFSEAFFWAFSGVDSEILSGQPNQGFAFEGQALNPLLQDIGLVLHPPMLYLGYVGFVVPFALLVAALWQGQLTPSIARWIKHWTMLAWALLTVGIALGSWWAYYELGWGGWWFWDPVENASLMPWLSATAFIHALSACEKSGAFKVWTAFLGIVTFSLALMGTFLVRSGVLTSVHAFATDTSRGVFILALLAVIAGGALLLLLIRAPRLQGGGSFAWVSKEMGLLINNLLLSLACLVVFVGTLAPLAYEVLGLPRISVGAPYFNANMLWLIVGLLVAMTFAPYWQWKRQRLPIMRLPIAIAVLLSVGVSWTINAGFTPINWQAIVLLALIFSAMLTALWDAYLQVQKRRWGFPSAGYVAMLVAHLGFLLCCSGIILSSFYALKKDVYLASGDTVVLGDYGFTLQNPIATQNQRYESVSVDVLVSQTGQTLGVISPEKRHYRISQMPMTEAGILPRLDKDIYVALGEPQNEQLDAWSMRLQVKPGIRLIWLGALVMALSAWFTWRSCIRHRPDCRQIASPPGERS